MLPGVMAIGMLKRELLPLPVGMLDGELARQKEDFFQKRQNLYFPPRRTKALFKNISNMIFLCVLLLLLLDFFLPD